ncbi:MAG: four helix bundle protein [Flavobacteriales bacterium]|nr:four helix bundle protein [Flavobacteriales bacterium]
MKLEDLKLYQECLDFEQKIWNIVNEWEGFNKETMGKPFTQSADAISGNIASGYGRYNFKDKKHYCYISRGYLLKTKGWLIKAKERELIGAEQSEELMEFIEKIHRMLNAYIRSIGRKKSDSYDGGNGYDESEEMEEVNGNRAEDNSFTASADEFFSSDELASNA